MARKALVAFVVCSLAHLIALAAEITWLEWSTKALLMPTLAAWVWLNNGSRLIVAALLLSAGGDIALQFDSESVFILGMAFFAAAHVCFVGFFVRAGAVAAIRRRWFIAAGYGVVWAILVAALWPGLGDLRYPVAGYSLLLTANAIVSAGYRVRTGLGGALFLISDALIAFGLADLPRPPLPGMWVMATYIAAQYLLASGATLPQRSMSGLRRTASASG